MKTKRKQSVLIPASYPGEVTPDEAIDARTFFVLRIKLFASDAKGNKSVAEQRNAYFLSGDKLKESVIQAKQLGWGVELETSEFCLSLARLQEPHRFVPLTSTIPGNREFCDVCGEHASHENHATLHAPAPVVGSKWLRFMFRMTETERGLLGRVLSGILYGHSMACLIEPWPDGDYAVYVKAEADNAKLVMRLTKEAGLTPVSAVEVDGLWAGK